MVCNPKEKAIIETINIRKEIANTIKEKIIEIEEAIMSPDMIERKK